MDIADFLTEDRIICGLSVASKKRILEISSGLFASELSDDINERQIFTALVERERLGGTGLGQGIAIPHGRLPGLKKALAAFIKLDQGVDFDAIDNQPVDLIFVLLVPENCSDSHLQFLSRIAIRFSAADYCRQLRSAQSVSELFELLLADENKLFRKGVTLCE